MNEVQVTKLAFRNFYPSYTVHLYLKRLQLDNVPLNGPQKTGAQNLDEKVVN